MFARFERSWALTKQCWALLSRNKVLVIFPILSGLASLLIIVSFAVPVFLSGGAQHFDDRSGVLPASTYLMMFLLYFFLYLVQTFFSCALMASANVAFAGGQSSLGVGDGIERSTSLIKKTWGEGMAKTLTFGAFTFLAVIVLMAGTIFLIFAVHPVIAIFFFLLGFVAVATVTSAMDGIFKVALYRYACWNMVPEGFSPELVHGAFMGKK